MQLNGALAKTIKHSYLSRQVNEIRQIRGMDYSVKSTLDENARKEISTWIKQTLDEMEVENDDVFIQYIMVMISGGKTMHEVSVELEAFLGNPECEQFVTSLGEMLKQIESASKPTRIAKLKTSSETSSNAAMSRPLNSSRKGSGQKDKAEALDSPLSSSRTQKAGDRQQSRLLQSALRTSLQPQQQNKQKRHIENTNENRGGFKTNKKNKMSSESASSVPQPSGMPGMSFDSAMMAQQVDSYANMMGFESSAAMMEFYRMSMMGMAQGAPMGGQWVPPRGGGWNEGRGGYRGR